MGIEFLNSFWSIPFNITTIITRSLIGLLNDASFPLANQKLEGVQTYVMHSNKTGNKSHWPILRYGNWSWHRVKNDYMLIFFYFFLFIYLFFLRTLMSSITSM